MEYQKKEDSNNEYGKLSSARLKMQEISGRDPVQGYSAPEKEEQENYAPVETMRMKNADGQFSVGINRKKEVTMAITSDAPGPYLRGDRSVVAMESARRVREIPDKIYTNSHDERVSGIVYKEDLAKSPANMLKTLKSTLEGRENVVVDAIAPFLVSSREIEAKKELETYLRGRLEQRQQEEYEIQKAEYDRLQKRLALKEKEEKRLIQNLTAASEKMKEQAEHLDYDYRKTYLINTGLSPEDGTEGENGDEDKDSAGDKSSAEDKDGGGDKGSAEDKDNAGGEAF